MSRALKIAIIIVAGLIIIGLAVYFLIFYKKGGTVVVTQQENVKELVATPQTTTPAGEKTPAEKQAVQTEVNIENMAKSFAERFGSFSNQSNFENITDLKLVMTDSMIKWSDDYIKNEKVKMAQKESSAYYGITTKAVSTNISIQNDSTAKVLVNCQRIETFSDGKTNIFYQDIEIGFKKVNNEWKVDSAYWK